MKAGLLSIAALSAIVAAAPHNIVKRAVEIDYVTDVEYVTATAPAQYVYVDQYGNRLGESTQAAAPTSVDFNSNWQHDDDHHAPAFTAIVPQITTEAPAPVQTTQAPIPAPAVSVPAIVPAVSVPAIIPVPAPSSEAAPVASSAPVAGSASGMGIAYSPYKLGSCGSSACAGICKSADEVKQDLKALSSYSVIRLYGTDCDQVSKVMGGLADSQKVFLGIYDIADVNTVLSDATALATAMSTNWHRVQAITVGNEFVNNAINNGQDSNAAVAAVKLAVSTASTALKAAGYTGPVSTVDTINAYTSHPDLCNAADSTGSVYANCHPFFDPNTNADGAATFVQGQIDQVKSTCKSVNNVVITESGWPSAGSPNGQAIPSKANQDVAVSKLTGAFTSNFYLFSAYNDLWKAPGQFGQEQSWGILGNSASS